MKQIFLMRHAKAVPTVDGLEDFDRPLSDKGRIAADLMGRYVASLAIRPSYVACSSALRTRQTWEIIASYLPEDQPMLFEDSLYLASGLALSYRLRELSNRAGSVLVIGHNPGLAELALAMSGDGSAEEDLRLLSQGMPTASFACILSEAGFWQDIDRAPSQLLGFVRPRDVEAALQAGESLPAPSQEAEETEETQE